MEEKQPQDPRPSSANFLNVLGVAMSGLAIVAVLISLFMTQMSLNEISLALDEIQSNLEVNSEDIEAIQMEEEGTMGEDEAMDDDLATEGETQIITLTTGFTMEIPENWQVQANRSDELVLVTETSPYVITETIEIGELEEITDSYTEVDETDYVTIYQIGCAPAMGCYAVEIDDEIFSMDWNIVESTEPVPDDLDGVWFPDANFDSDDIETILSSIMPATK